MAFESEIFLLIENRNYREASLLLQLNHDLNVNALNKDGRTLLTYALTNYEITNECHAFIEQILSNPKFEHANRPEGKIAATPLKKVMSHDNIELLELILKYKDSKKIQMIFEKNKLWYEIRAVELQTVLQAISEESKVFTDKDVIREQNIMEVFRELTMQHAFKTDDPSILQRMADAGAKLLLPFKNGTRPMDSIRDKKDLKVHEWMSKHMTSQVATSESALENLEHEHQQKQADLIFQHGEASKARVRALFQFSQESTASVTSSTPLSEAMERMKKGNESLNTKMLKFFSIQDSLNDLEHQHKEQQKSIATQQVAATKDKIRSTFRSQGDSEDTFSLSTKPSSKADGPSAS